MSNLSPLGAIHSPIDSDRDASAYLADFKAMGLPDRSPFDVLAKPRAAIKPMVARAKKPSKTRLQQALAALDGEMS